MSNKFKVGDEVRFVHQPENTDFDGGLYGSVNGRVGKVTHVSASLAYPYTVTFDDPQPISAIKESELTLITTEVRFDLSDVIAANKRAEDAVRKVQQLIKELTPEPEPDFIDSLGIGASFWYEAISIYVITKVGPGKWQNSYVHTGSGEIGNTEWLEEHVREEYAYGTLKLISKGIQS